MLHRYLDVIIERSIQFFYSGYYIIYLVTFLKYIHKILNINCFLLSANMVSNSYCTNSVNRTLTDIERTALRNKDVCSEKQVSVRFVCLFIGS